MEKQSLKELVLAFVGDAELADHWWYSPNKAFEMRRPIDVDLREVREYLMYHIDYGGS